MEAPMQLLLERNAFISSLWIPMNSSQNCCFFLEKNLSRCRWIQLWGRGYRRIIWYEKRACSDKNAETLLMNVVLFSSDRTAVSSSWNPDMIGKLKELNNYLVVICCVSHRLKLALKDAMRNWVESADTCVFNFYYLYKKSTVFSIGPFQNVQHEVIYFPYVVRKNEKPLDIVQKL